MKPFKLDLMVKSYIFNHDFNVKELLAAVWIKNQFSNTDEKLLSVIRYNP